MKYFLLLLTFLLVAASCGKDELSVEEQFALDTKMIEDYLVSKNLTAQKNHRWCVLHHRKGGKHRKTKNNK